MSGKPNLAFVKKVPDFIQKLGLNNQELKTFKERNDHKLEDKQGVNAKEYLTADEARWAQEKEEYDFENAQIEDLGNFIISAQGQQQSEAGVGGGDEKAEGGEEQ